MQTLSIAEYGIYYLKICFQYYNEHCAYFLFYIAALLFIGMKGTKREKQIFLPSAGLLLLTVFNPVFPVVINRVFDINKEYYRFFWIPPVVIVTAYFGARIVEMQKREKQIFTIILLAVVLCITGNFVYHSGYIKSPNIYKMPTEIPEISEIIHNDSNVEYPRAVFEYDFNMLIRQYDAKILLACDREAYLNAVGGVLTMDMIQADENLYNRLLAVVALNIPIEKEKFCEALDATNTEYVVVSLVNPMTGYLQEAGLTMVDTTQNHVVYHYDLKDPKEFVLPDYTDVWEAQ